MTDIFSVRKRKPYNPHIEHKFVFAIQVYKPNYKSYAIEFGGFDTIFKCEADAHDKAREMANERNARYVPLTSLHYKDES